MPNSDFEGRLSRIKAGARQSAVPSSSAEGIKSGRRRRFIVACFTIGAGGQLIRVANINYDSLRDQYGVLAAAGLGLVSIAIMIFGVFLMIGAVRPARSASAYPSTPAYPTSVARPQVQASAGARLFFSLFGLALGGLACLFMYVGNASRQLGVTGQVDPETANAMATGSAIAAFLLVALGFFIGFIGIFVRRLPMRRVPVFLVLGTMLVFTSFQMLSIHPANWPTFMAEFSRSFTNQITR